LTEGVEHTTANLLGSGVATTTGIQSREGKAYRCLVLDACSKWVMGWAIDSSANTAHVINALTMAIERRRTTNDDTQR